MTRTALLNSLHCCNLGSFSTTGVGEAGGGLAGVVCVEVDVNRLLFPPFFLEKSRLAKRNML